MNPPVSAALLADQSRDEIRPLLNRANRGDFGQFMTPAKVASFMAGMFGELPDHVRLLDAGAGLGSLTAAFITEACSRQRKPKSISVTAFEIDAVIAEYLATTLNTCKKECARAGIAFSYRIIRNDYILHSAEPLISATESGAPFNCAILNPPYRKINSSSPWRKALRRLSIETSNLYAAFVAIALRQMTDNGQLVAITPRSFCNGAYFAPFRRMLLETSAIEHIHVYSSRRQAFMDDGVLQENIIYRITVRKKQPDRVKISFSDGPLADNIIERSARFDEVVLPSDRERYIRLPATDRCSDLAMRVRALPATLHDLGAGVSTGRVVDFRVRSHLRKLPNKGTVPLIYATHFAGSRIAWPKAESRKANALAFNDQTLSLVVPKGTYVLTKRFTSKEERRRLVATIYDPKRIKAKYVGFENHLNYFHQEGTGLAPAFARGLAAFLNCTAVDDFFRQFSGHTQVNATDLRNMHYPSRTQLESLGNEVGNEILAQEELDGLVSELLPE